MPHVALSVALISSASSGQSFVREPLPRAPGARVTTITDPGPFTETSIAIDPRNPRRVVGVYQNQASAAWSADGVTWAIAEGTAPPNYRVSGDPSVTIDRHGHAFFCYIAFDRTGVTSYWALGATRGGIFVRRSLDGGKTWEKEHNVVVEHPVTQPGLPWEDMPSITADTREKSPHRDVERW